jgi:hypothetical protein
VPSATFQAALKLVPQGSVLEGRCEQATLSVAEHLPVCLPLDANGLS